MIQVGQHSDGPYHRGASGIIADPQVVAARAKPFSICPLGSDRRAVPQTICGNGAQQSTPSGRPTDDRRAAASAPSPVWPLRARHLPHNGCCQAPGRHESRFSPESCCARRCTRQHPPSRFSAVSGWRGHYHRSARILAPLDKTGACVPRSISLTPGPRTPPGNSLLGAGKATIGGGRPAGRFPNRLVGMGVGKRREQGIPRSTLPSLGLPP